MLSNGPQLGSCNLQMQATGESAIRFLKSCTSDGAGHWRASRKGSAASGNLPSTSTSGTLSAPVQRHPPVPGPRPPPSPTHSTESGTQRSATVPSSPAHVLLALKCRFNFKHTKWLLISKGLFAGSAACTGALQVRGRGAWRRTPGTKNSDEARKWGV